MTERRDALRWVGATWSMIVVTLLDHGEMRFTGLRGEIDGITAKTLAATLRGLERDGIVTRTVHPVIPRRVEYALTPLGRTLVGPVSEMLGWADKHLTEVEASRCRYDADKARYE
jgi:DNA-binding HxlR family transcriptional regulator